MRIAIPIANGQLAMHFGHCDAFALIDVDPKSQTIIKNEQVTSPNHQPGLLPRWLSEQGAEVIIAGGMGSRAQELFTENNIRVLVGAPGGTPESLVASFLSDTLNMGENICDH